MRYLFCQTDFTECSKRSINCSLNAECSKIMENFSCVCDSGYIGNGSICTGAFWYFDANIVSKRLVCIKWWIFIDHLCFVDVDECSLSTDNCHKYATCKNTYGSYSCKCNWGYFGNGTYCSGED